ncbi:hypothetical protein HMPREF3157_02155 [Dermabacter sp. HMSC06F07]|uniref:hypothetical protein n=1 Tax=Dermabacter sp. HMSC06F07 TaxID=1581125 RepID=UPI0008A2D400|nr:hypothetical protein [Dermabacter sp. HMSC06F07]OFT48016.1 hypothetical protein HMPREF3157_02155 [Dermabacter sp. HMSC06F07]
MTQRESSIDRATEETRAELNAHARKVRELASVIYVAAAVIRDDSSRLPIHRDTYRLIFEAFDLVTIAGNQLDPDRSEGQR